jgi:hypothetical protein
VVVLQLGLSLCAWVLGDPAVAPAQVLPRLLQLLHNHDDLRIVVMTLLAEEVQCG